MASLKIEHDYKKEFDLSVRKLILSAESISENSLVFSSTAPSFFNYLADVKSRVSNGFYALNKITTNLLRLDFMKSNFDKVSFIDISTMLVAIPEGFSENLFDYSTIMKVLYKDISEKSIDFLNTINVELGRIINTNSAKITSENLEKLYLPYQKLRLDALEITSKFFTPNSTKSRDTLGNIFRNKTEVYDTFTNTKDLETQVKNTNIKSIMDLMDDTVALLKEINKQIKLDSNTKFSPQVIQFLGNGIKEAALFLEFLSTMFYDADVLITVCNEIKKDLNRVSSRG